MKLDKKKLFHHARSLGVTRVIMSDKKYAELCQEISGENWVEDLEIFGIKIIPEIDFKFSDRED